MRIRKYPVSVLPIEFPFRPFLSFDKFITLYFNFLNEIGNKNNRLKPNKYVSMIRHAINREHFSLPILNQGRKIFMQFFLIFPGYHALSSLNSKDKLKIYL